MEKKGESAVWACDGGRGDRRLPFERWQAYSTVNLKVHVLNYEDFSQKTQVPQDTMYAHMSPQRKSLVPVGREHRPATLIPTPARC